MVDYKIVLYLKLGFFFIIVTVLFGELLASLFLFLILVVLRELATSELGLVRYNRLIFVRIG
jgi:hypothetical protein